MTLDPSPPSDRPDSAGRVHADVPPGPGSSSPVNSPVSTDDAAPATSVSPGLQAYRKRAQLFSAKFPGVPYEPHEPGFLTSPLAVRAIIALTILFALAMTVSIWLRSDTASLPASNVVINGDATLEEAIAMVTHDGRVLATIPLDKEHGHGGLLYLAEGSYDLTVTLEHQTIQQMTITVGPMQTDVDSVRIQLAPLRAALPSTAPATAPSTVPATAPSTAPASNASTTGPTTSVTDAPRDRPEASH